MRNFFRYIFLKPILWLVRRFESAPDRVRIFEALSLLRVALSDKPGKKGFIIPYDYKTSRFIIFSDQHKGAKNGADDFALAEPNYIAALQHYDREGFHLISLGDAEELWENTLAQVKNSNTLSFEAESRFVHRHAFTKIFGNHDLDWEINPMAPAELKSIYNATVVALEAVLLEASFDGEIFSIFCTHGHQGDAQSDGNFFAKFFVSKIWAPLQAYLRINPNTPAYNVTLKTEHNGMMYDWSSRQQNVVLITGHTHQPVFESLTHYERDQRQARPDDFANIIPSYFNTGCCCYDDGDITGIELCDGEIRLIKWESKKNGESVREILECSKLEDVFKKLISSSRP